MSIPQGEALTEQNGDDNDVYLILAGVSDISVNGRVIAKRGPGSHVGEMAAVQPSQKRSATCVAAEDIVAVKLPEADFSELASRYPEMYRAIARELSRRLLERNSTINAYREKIRVCGSACKKDPFLGVIGV